MNKNNQEFPLDIQVENDSERYTDRNLEIDEDDEVLFVYYKLYELNKLMH